VGIRATNPAWMPLALPSAPGSAIALAFGARGFNITLGGGGGGGFSALAVAGQLLAARRATACVVVAMYSPDEHSARSTSECIEGNGFLSEGAAALVLELDDRHRIRQELPGLFYCLQLSQLHQRQGKRHFSAA